MSSRSFLSGATAIFLREMQIFRLRIVRPTYALSSLITPLMYLLVFGLGLGRQVRIDGSDYLSFLIPGLIGMTAMSNAFSWVAGAINFSRFYYRTWALVILAPVSPFAICAGNIAAGLARALIATSLIALTGLAAGWRPMLTPVFPLALLVEMVCFAALGVLVGVKTKTSEEHMAYANFLITPMGFFCGTFFPLDNLPIWLAYPLRALPLTQATIALRSPGFTAEAFLALGALALITGIVLFLAVRAVANYAE